MGSGRGLRPAEHEKEGASGRNQRQGASDVEEGRHGSSPNDCTDGRGGQAADRCSSGIAITGMIDPAILVHALDNDALAQAQPPPL